MTNRPKTLEVLVISAGQPARHYWRDALRYRELFYVLVWRDLAVRYKQTAIGLLWAVIRPLLTMLIFTFVFGSLGRLPPGGAPYTLTVLAGLLPWQLFAGSMTEGGSSLLTNSGMLTKIYFPRIVLPLSSVCLSFVDLVIAVLLLAVLMAAYGYQPDWRIGALPLFAILTLALSTAAATWISALTVKYRDIRYVVPFVVQVGLYLSPVGFNSSVVPERFQFLFALNPMVGIIDGFRWCLLRGSTGIYWPGIACSVVATLLLLVSGLRNFRRVESSFADLV